MKCKYQLVLFQNATNIHPTVATIIVSLIGLFSLAAANHDRVCSACRNTLQGCEKVRSSLLSPYSFVSRFTNMSSSLNAAASTPKIASSSASAKLSARTISASLCASSFALASRGAAKYGGRMMGWCQSSEKVGFLAKDVRRSCLAMFTIWLGVVRK